jgi:hypothetical protein
VVATGGDTELGHIDRRIKLGKAIFIIILVMMAALSSACCSGDMPVELMLADK